MSCWLEHSTSSSHLVVHLDSNTTCTLCEIYHTSADELRKKNVSADTLLVPCRHCFRHLLVHCCHLNTYCLAPSLVCFSQLHSMFTQSVAEANSWALRLNLVESPMQDLARIALFVPKCYSVVIGPRFVLVVEITCTASAVLLLGTQRPGPSQPSLSSVTTGFNFTCALDRPQHCSPISLHCLSDLRDSLAG
jgi:hypothetical protein